MYPLWQHNYLTKAVAFLNGKKFLVCSSQKIIYHDTLLFTSIFFLSLSLLILFYFIERVEEEKFFLAAARCFVSAACFWILILRVLCFRCQ